MPDGHEVRTDSVRPQSNERTLGIHRELSQENVHQDDPAGADNSSTRPPEPERVELTRRLASLRAGLDTLKREHFEADSDAFADTISALYDEIDDMLQVPWLKQCG